MEDSQFARGLGERDTGNSLTSFKIDAGVIGMEVITRSGSVLGITDGIRVLLE